MLWGPRCLSLLYIAVCICSSQTPIFFLPSFPLCFYTVSLSLFPHVCKLELIFVPHTPRIVLLKLLSHGTLVDFETDLVDVKNGSNRTTKTRIYHAVSDMHVRMCVCLSVCVYMYVGPCEMLHGKIHFLPWVIVRKLESYCSRLTV